MSEARRKKQHERVGDSPSSAMSKKSLIWGGIVVLFAAVYLGGWYYKNHKYDKFAQCLATKQAKMYGLYWCPHCIEQKEMFGESFHYVNYVECAVKGSTEMAPQCKIAGVKLFPSWQFADEPPKEGVLSLEALSDKTGCSLP
ncbi:MAG TPA: hypothetical protein VMQ17_13115 [Candidatus Sulfotelmatobacter sp.]|nr:hypothetical protein [Candidatus Sulfotelmatobacter sp.]